MVDKEVKPMSLELVRSVMNSLPTTQAWMVSLVKIKNSRRNGTTYATRGITLSPQGALSRFVTDLSKVYVEGEKGLINKYTSVVDYDGSAEAIKIYKLQSNSQLIADEYTNLIQAMSTPEMNGDPFEFAANAYALKATLTIDGEDRSVMLFSLQNPICVLKNRFLYDNSTFFELNKKVLNLRQNIDVIIIDDMISSGESMIDVASELKKRGASRVFCATTFGLFTNGFDKFDEAYEKGIIDKILTTNLVYQPDELLSKPWYINVDMSKYMALLIDTLNHDSSISDLLNPVDRIQKRVKEYNERYTK